MKQAIEIKNEIAEARKDFITEKGTHSNVWALAIESFEEKTANEKKLQLVVDLIYGLQNYQEFKKETQMLFSRLYIQNISTKMCELKPFFKPLLQKYLTPESLNTLHNLFAANEFLDISITQSFASFVKEVEPQCLEEYERYKQEKINSKIDKWNKKEKNKPTVSNIHSTLNNLGFQNVNETDQTHSHDNKKVDELINIWSNKGK